MSTDEKIKKRFEEEKAIELAVIGTPFSGNILRIVCKQYAMRCVGKGVGETKKHEEHREESSSISSGKNAEEILNDLRGHLNGVLTLVGVLTMDRNKLKKDL